MKEMNMRQKQTALFKTCLIFPVEIESSHPMIQALFKFSKLELISQQVLVCWVANYLFSLQICGRYFIFHYKLVVPHLSAHMKLMFG